MINLNKCAASYNVLSPKIYGQKGIEDINVKAFDMITNKDKAKATTEHISFDWKDKFNSTTCIWKQKWNNETCPCGCKNDQKCDKDYSI